MKNNLLSQDKLAEIYGQYRDKFSELRGSGRSTSLSLQIIANAVANPNIPFVIVDHWGVSSADDCLLRMVRQHLDKLQLTNMVITSGMFGSKAVKFLTCTRVSNDTY